MAIIIEEEKKNNLWLTVGALAFTVLFLGAVTYYLFFTDVPHIEQVIVSPELQSISKVSKINLEVVASVTGSPLYKSLVKRVNDPNLGGVLGRQNPFVPF